LSDFVWKKPVICIFRERTVNPESDPFVVVKAKEMTISQMNDKTVTGDIRDFFTLMGDADYLTTEEGLADHYVMCWFDDAEPDDTKDLRRLRGVTFTSKATYTTNPRGKRTYQGAFKAEHAKLT
jgi:hypothetical protein